MRTESVFRESPGSSVVQTPHFHCRFDPWSENLRSSMPCGADKKKMRREKKVRLHYMLQSIKCAIALCQSVQSIYLNFKIIDD